MGRSVESRFVCRTALSVVHGAEGRWIVHYSRVVREVHLSSPRLFNRETPRRRVSRGKGEDVDMNHELVPSEPNRAPIGLLSELFGSIQYCPYQKAYVVHLSQHLVMCRVEVRREVSVKSRHISERSVCV